MKNKLARLRRWMESHRVTNVILNGARALWGLLSHNLGLKALSLLMAVLLWNFVITSNTTITRTKTITGLTGYITSQSALNTYGLALLDNPTEQLSDISVTVEVAQSEYAYVSSDNVQVTLDLSSVRTAGTQEVSLVASTSYGRVVRIMPDTLTLTFETLDSRMIPVNVQIVGETETDRWYNVNRTNPTAVTISGAASVVQSIASAYVYVDVTGYDSSFITADQYVLLDSEGNEITASMLNRSSSSITVNMDVYPTKEIPISTEIDSVVTGEPADGYVVESVSIQPESLVVAADQELLDSIAELQVEPVSVAGRSRSFTARASVASLSSFRSISADEVYVNVTIVEETTGAWIEGVKVSYINRDENLNLTYDTGEIRVYVTGPRSVIEDLQQNGFAATVDLSGLTAGTYALAPTFPVDTYPDVTFTPDPGELEVTLTEVEPDAAE